MKIIKKEIKTRRVYRTSDGRRTSLAALLRRGRTDEEIELEIWAGILSMGIDEDPKTAFPRLLRELQAGGHGWSDRLR
ncbi:hypothetical protein ASA1KI_21340 [Opitutales bacterium ASA1]|nr:hypothetical protein ASA1KI_21340 [Opitutales bacterium ASA1]